LTKQFHLSHYTEACIDLTNTPRSLQLTHDLLFIVSHILCAKLHPTFHSVPSPQLTNAHMKIAIDQGIAGLLFQLLNGRSSFNYQQLQTIESIWLTQVGGALARSDLLNRYWPSNHPPPMIIKGIDLEEHLYAPLGIAPGVRTCSDWDLLVPDPIYTSIIEHWTKHFGAPLQPQTARLPHESPHELGFYIDGFLFEVHRDPAPLFFTTVSGEYLWVDRDHIESSWGQQLSKPSLQHRLLIWLINYAKSGGVSRLLDWVDLALIINSLPAKLQESLTHDSLQITWISINGLQHVTQDVMHILSSTPLRLILNLNLPHEQCIENMTPLMRSLQRSRSPLQVALHQVKYCHPKLRGEYLKRALLKATVYLSPPTAPRSF
jgi:hypothetical protein